MLRMIELWRSFDTFDVVDSFDVCEPENPRGIQRWGSHVETPGSVPLPTTTSAIPKVDHPLRGGPDLASWTDLASGDPLPERGGRVTTRRPIPTPDALGELAGPVGVLIGYPTPHTFPAALSGRSPGGGGEDRSGTLPRSGLSERH